MGSRLRNALVLAGWRLAVVNVAVAICRLPRRNVPRARTYFHSQNVDFSIHALARLSKCMSNSSRNQQPRSSCSSCSCCCVCVCTLIPAIGLEAALLLHRTIRQRWLHSGWPTRSSPCTTRYMIKSLGKSQSCMVCAHNRIWSSVPIVGR